jgi:lipopolysaccharide heptosyltransferase II
MNMSVKGESILIVLLGALGDVVRGFSILPPLRKAYPNSKITWLVEPRCIGIVKLHPLIDEVLLFDRASPLKAIKEFKAKAEKERFTITLDLQRHFKSGVLSFLSRSPIRVGFHRKNCKEGNFLFNNRFIKEYDPTLSKVWHYQSFLEVLQISSPKEVSFGLQEALTSEDVPEVLRNQSDVVGVVLGSTWETKNWKMPHYITLVKDLLREGKKVALLGDKSQRSIGEEIVKACGESDRLHQLGGHTTLRELLGAISQCEVVVGPDSGPGHIAAALKKPYVSLFGPTTENRVGPFGQEHLVVRAPLGCAPCMRRECKPLQSLCMELITPSLVMERIKSVCSR